ncbi:MAG TPA: SDR family NAD(P)-dependent oxidoreductase [Solirubrobacteraceae bacterium]|nr:SDR family NAD(P)-dependent oxidoreductase [Solirubrobacteraceae bacterium]
MKISTGRVVVTGAGSGIGRATALRLARKGANLVAVDIDESSAQATAEECVVGGVPAFYQCDVSDREAVEDLAERIEAELGPVDVLVNNAGVGLVGDFLDGTLKDWDWLRGVNLDGVAYGCHAFGGRMVARRRGHVVNVASGAGYLPHRTLAAYCATKAGVIMLSQCLRADWARHRVGVSVICPGVIDTPIASRARMVGAAERKRAAAVRALGFGRSPDVVARAILGAVEHNRGIVPVGVESSVAFRVLRFAPGPVQAALARAEVI